MGTKDAVLEAALRLPPRERASLAEELIESLDEAGTEEVDAAWVAEVERRMRDDGGESAFLTPTELEAEVKRILKR